MPLSSNVVPLSNSAHIAGNKHGSSMTLAGSEQNHASGPPCWSVALNLVKEAHRDMYSARSASEAFLLGSLPGMLVCPLRVKKLVT